VEGNGKSFCDEVATIAAVVHATASTASGIGELMATSGLFGIQ
jgi:hypothetical protein